MRLIEAYPPVITGTYTIHEYAGAHTYTTNHKRGTTMSQSTFNLLLTSKQIDPATGKHVTLKNTLLTKEILPTLAHINGYKPQDMSTEVWEQGIAAISEFTGMQVILQRGKGEDTETCSLAKSTKFWIALEQVFTPFKFDVKA